MLFKTWLILLWGANIGRKSTNLPRLHCQLYILYKRTLNCCHCTKSNVSLKQQRISVRKQRTTNEASFQAKFQSSEFEIGHLCTCVSTVQSTKSAWDKIQLNGTVILMQNAFHDKYVLTFPTGDTQASTCLLQYSVFSSVYRLCWANIYTSTSN